jgi:hypothetical protein
MVIALDVLDRSGSTTGTGITGAAAHSTETGGEGAGVRFSFSVSSSVNLCVMPGAGTDRTGCSAERVVHAGSIDFFSTIGFRPNALTTLTFLGVEDTVDVVG